MTASEPKFGTVILCLLCLWCRAPAIENDVLEVALACASDAGLNPEQVSVSGRDVTLTGMTSSQETHDLVTSCIAAFSGTRTIIDDLEVLLGGSRSCRTFFREGGDDNPSFQRSDSGFRFGAESDDPSIAPSARPSTNGVTSIDNSNLF